MQLRQTWPRVGRRILYIPHPYTPSARHFASSAQQSPEIYDVVCVGGGPAGLSLLASLRASPVTSRLKIALVEGQDLKRVAGGSQPAVGYSNRCVSLTPTSEAHLKAIGAWSYINTTRTQPYQEMQVWDGVSDARISFDWAEPSAMATTLPESTTIATMIETQNLTSGLLKYLSELGGVSMISPARVDDIQLGSDTEGLDLSSWPVLTLSNGQSLAARLLVGADGANSPVRTFAGIPSRGWDYNRHGVVATLQLDNASRAALEYKTAYQRFLPTGPVAMLPLPGNYASLVWSTTPSCAARLKTLKSEDFVAMVNAAFRLSTVDLQYLHSIEAGQKDEVAWRLQHTRTDEARCPATVTAVQEGSVAAFPLKMRHADTYAGERVALVGDAAHTIHPLAGQGLNQGQGDAASLSRVIETAVSQGADIGSQLSLEPYTSERYAANNALLGAVDKLHKLYSVQSGPLVPLRSWGLQAVNAAGPLKQFFMRRAAGL